MERFLEWCLGAFIETEIYMNNTLIDRLKEFMECEGRSCSFNPELITPEYVYRMWGGAVAIEDIATAMEGVRRMR